MKRTKIHILYKFQEGPWGGGNQFLNGLRKELLRLGVYEEDPEKAEIVLLNSHHNLKECLRIKRFFPSKVVILRLDGPISLIRRRDSQLDKIIALFNKLVVDGIVFQSNWSREQNKKLFGISSRYETVIHNAPDSDTFNQSSRKDFDPNGIIRLIATSWSSNWRKGFEIYKYLDENLDLSRYEMTFVGNSPIEFKNLKWIRPIPPEKLAEILKQNDIYITASQNDPCSNSLLEGLLSGLPAVALNDGGHPELIKEGGELFTGREDVIEKIEKVAQNYGYYQTKILEFSIEEVAQKYYEFVQKIWGDIRSGRHRPKQLNFALKVNFGRVKFMILGWKIVSRLRRIREKIWERN